VTGAPWDAFLAAELLAPLGMARTALTVAGRSSLSVATPHAWRLGAQVPVGAPAPFVGPAGSTPVSSARDMAAYLAAWLEPGPGAPRSRRGRTGAAGPTASAGCWAATRARG